MINLLFRSYLRSVTDENMRNEILKASYSDFAIIAVIEFLIGFVVTGSYIYLGIYRPELNFITIPFLILQPIVFITTIVILIFKTQIKLRILVTIPLVGLLMFLTFVCVNSALTIIEFGELKCDLCP